jgi:hypothetical protein
MGANISKQNNTILTDTVNNTTNKVYQTEIQKIIDESGQTSTNINSTEISDITCGGSVNIGQINQSIKQTQNLSQALDKMDYETFRTTTEQAAQNAATAMGEQSVQNGWTPLQGNNSETNQMIITNTKNSVLNETNINKLYESYKSKVQEATNINKSKINDIICGGDFKLEGVSQNIEAIQLANDMSKLLTDSVIAQGTKITTENKVKSSSKQSAENKGPMDAMMGPIIAVVVGCVICFIVLGIVVLAAVLILPKLMTSTGSALHETTKGVTELVDSEGGRELIKTTAKLAPMLMGSPLPLPI